MFLQSNQNIRMAEGSRRAYQRSGGCERCASGSGDLQGLLRLHHQGIRVAAIDDLTGLTCFLLDSAVPGEKRLTSVLRSCK